MKPPMSPVPLPERDKSFLRIVWARAGTVERAYSFSPAVVGRFMHWCNGRTMPCLEPDAGCAWCLERVARRWYGWLYGHSINHQCPCLIQLTEQSVRECVLLRDPGVNLAGALVELTRSNSARNSVVKASVTLNKASGRIPAGEPDVFAHMMRFFKLPYYPEGRDPLPGSEES